jgi:hypothetical protein
MAVVMNSAINVNPHLNPPPRVGEETIFFSPSRWEEVSCDGVAISNSLPPGRGKIKEVRK